LGGISYDAPPSSLIDLIANPKVKTTKRQGVWVCSLCCDPNLGLATKAKGLQGCAARLNPGLSFSCPGSAKECEGKNSHTPK